MMGKSTESTLETMMKDAIKRDAKKEVAMLMTIRASTNALGSGLEALTKHFNLPTREVAKVFSEAYGAYLISEQPDLAGKLESFDEFTEGIPDDEIFGKK